MPYVQGECFHPRYHLNSRRIHFCSFRTGFNFFHPIRHPGNVGTTLEPTWKTLLSAFSVQSTARGLLPQARSRRFSPAISSLCFAPPGTPPCHCILGFVFLKLLSIIVGNAARCQSFRALFLTFRPACALLNQVCLIKIRSLYP